MIIPVWLLTWVGVVVAGAGEEVSLSQLGLMVDVGLS